MKLLPDDPIVDYLKDTVGIVEANSYEKMMLWREFSDEAGRFAITDHVKYSWKDTGHGYGVTVAYKGKKSRPVFISLLTAVIDGRKLLFWHPTSQIVDYKKIDEWFMENLPESAFTKDGYINRTDPMNFNNILR